MVSFHHFKIKFGFHKAVHLDIWTGLAKGTWVAQLVKYQTLDFGSSHDLTVHGIEPHVGLRADSMEPAWDFSLPLSTPPLLSLSPSLSLLKLKKKLNIKKKE